MFPLFHSGWVLGTRFSWLQGLEYNYCSTKRSIWAGFGSWRGGRAIFLCSLAVVSAWALADVRFCRGFAVIIKNSICSFLFCLKNPGYHLVLHTTPVVVNLKASGSFSWCLHLQPFQWFCKQLIPCIKPSFAKNS